MSAIVGRIDLSGQHVEAEPFAASLSALASYGVDGFDTVVGENFRIGIQRLNLGNRDHMEMTPLQLGGTILVADAVLNNRDELGASLAYGQADLADLSDAMLIQRSFKKWGKECPRHILGDYSFAAYDQQKRSLFLTRDHIGTRPLYWSRRDNTVLFATDIRAIVANTDFSWPADEEAVAHHLLDPSRPQLSTFFQHIKNIPPATGLTVDNTGTVENNWWSPHQVPAFRYKTHEEYLEHFQALLVRLGQDYTATPGNIGAHFSGGVDSFTVAAFAAKALKSRNRSLKAGYSWAPAVSEDYPIISNRDERHAIQSLGQKLHVPVRYGTADGNSRRRYLDLELELDGIGNLSDEIPILEMAKSDNLKVMLSGWGGDEAYSSHGIGYLAYTLKKGQFRELRNTIQYHTGARKFRPLKSARALFSWGIVPMLPDFLYHRVPLFHDIYDNGAFPTPAMQARAPNPATSAKEYTRFTSDPRTFVANHLQFGHLSMRMETWAAWSSQFGFQYRYPLLDRRVLEFILGMPRHLFIFRGQDRYLARETIKDLVPERLSKYDRANELFRNDSRLDCWRLLQQDLLRGVFDCDSDWVDMVKLRHVIDSKPQDMSLDLVSKMAKIQAAVRVWKMEQRFKSNYKAQMHK